MDFRWGISLRGSKGGHDTHALTALRIRWVFRLEAFWPDLGVPSRNPDYLALARTPTGRVTSDGKRMVLFQRSLLYCSVIELDLELQMAAVKTSFGGDLCCCGGDGCWVYGEKYGGCCLWTLLFFF